MSLFVYDSLLGHVPNPGVCGPGFGESFHTIGADGLRTNGTAQVPEGGTVLAVGDSFTYGDEVTDEQTWPAQLQKILNRPVLNGGVTGYGFDQTVLRAEQLAARYRPSVIIVSFIAHDIERTEMRRMWWRDKPWFSITDDQLVLKGVPVPQRTSLPLKMRQRLDGLLVDFPPLLQRLVGYNSRVHRRGQGVAISQRLTGRLAGLRTQEAVKIVVMAQYPPVVWQVPRIANQQRRMTRAILEAAMSNGLATLDTFQRLASEPTPLNYYGHAHMNARGNSMIAALLAAALPALLNPEDR